MRYLAIAVTQPDINIRFSLEGSDVYRGRCRWFRGACARDAPADELPPGLSKQQRADVMAMAKAVTTHDTFAAGDLLAGGR